MQNNDLIIEKFAVDIFAEQHSNPNGLLYDLSRNLRQEILPLVEANLRDIQANNPVPDLKINRLELDFNIPDGVEWKADLSRQIVEQIVKEHQKQIELRGGITAIYSDHKTTENLIDALTHFYSTGAFVKNANPLDINDIKKLQDTILDLKADQLLMEKLFQFLIENETNTNRFLRNHSDHFMREFLGVFFSKQAIQFLLDFHQLNTISHHFKEKTVYFLLKDSFLTTNSNSKIRRDLRLSNSTDFDNLLNEITIKSHHFYTKHIKTLEKLKDSNTKHNLSELIKSKSDANLFIFIQYLRSDANLKEIIDPLLHAYFSGNLEQQVLASWAISFSHFIQNQRILGDILIELEELKPLNGNLTKPEYFAKELIVLISELEEREKHVKNASTTDETTEIIRSAAKEQPIHTENGGIILLNPFLPALFKNLQLQTEKGEWLSKEDQEWAIYLLHYLATGTFTATEDQLYLAKILTGYPLDEVLNSFENNEKNPSETTQKRLKQVDEIELPNMLNAIRENWRPMRNCTWNGLQNDFLIRPGTLESNETMQYKLILEPHTLDVLIPHIKWGISMIKYSWMGEVVYVEWG